MDEEALNKKLAGWAGIKLAGKPDRTGFYMFADSEGTVHWAKFTESLDACAEWLIPKLLKTHTVEIVIMETGTRVTIYDDFKGAAVTGDKQESPARALCSAIEKLLDVTNG